MRLPSLSLQGKIALVTGAGSGIGRASAGLLAAAGARVALLGHTADEVEEGAREISAAGGEAIACVADVSDAAAMEAAVDRVRETWGGLHVVVANAGVNGLWAPLEEIAPEDWDRTIAINLRGTYLTVRAALPLLKRSGGSVVVVSSVNGTRMFSNTGATAYSVSKAGQVAFSRMVALELAPFHVRVNTVCPGAIHTRISDNTTQRDLEKIRVHVDFPEGRIPLTDGEPGSARQVAELVLFLAGDASAHITGTEVFIDGGQSLLQG
jgi:Dehydrogenases with different specificities (related to short-chain alcohol dehydrogenases)